VLSVRFMIKLEVCVPTQSWVNMEHALLWGPCVEDQHSGGVASYLHHLSVACQEVQDPVAQGGVQTQDPKVNDELGGC
jgi:hypothetical protein